MNAEQLELEPVKFPWASMVEEGDVERLVNELRGRGWVTAADLGARTESDKRIIRAICEASNARIVSGAHGYRLLAEMSVDDYGKCRGRLCSMVRGLARRVRDLDRAYHAGGATPRV